MQYSDPAPSEIIARLKERLDVESDAKLAELLEVPASTLANWRRRRSLPYAVCVRAALTHGLSLDWLILGKGTSAFDPDAAALAAEVIVEGAVFLEAAADAKKHELIRGAFQKWYGEFEAALGKLDRAGADRGRAIEKVRTMIRQGPALAFIDVVGLDTGEEEEG